MGNRKSHRLFCMWDWIHCMEGQVSSCLDNSHQLCSGPVGARASHNKLFARKLERAVLVASGTVALHCPPLSLECVSMKKAVRKPSTCCKVQAQRNLCFVSLVIVLKGGELPVVPCPHDTDSAIAATKGLERTVYLGEREKCKICQWRAAFSVHRVNRVHTLNPFEAFVLAMGQKGTGKLRYVEIPATQLPS